MLAGDAQGERTVGFFLLLSDRLHSGKCCLVFCNCGGFDGGSGEIRTHERVTPSPVFKTGAFNHSATLPLGNGDYAIEKHPAQSADYAAMGTIASENHPFNFYN